jgi:hypothetical protein
MTKAKVYVETTVASYLAAAPSRHIVVAGHQETTRTWWSRCDRFELFVSQAVVEVTPHILWRRRGRATHDGRTASLRKPSELAARATDGNAHRRRQKSAWGDEVGPHAAADTPPQVRFAGQRSGFLERGGPAVVGLAAPRNILGSPESG